MEKATGQQAPGLLWAIAGLLFVVLIGIFDYAAPSGISLAPLYLVPILIVVHRAGLRAGLAIAVASGIACIQGQTGEIPGIYPWVPYWNAAALALPFVLVAFFAGKMDAAQGEGPSGLWVDSVSGAGNAQYFYRLAEAELNRARRHGRAFTIAYLDVDHLKSVNDQFGRLGGDTLLSLVARTVARQIRKSDVLARVGGDEFALLLPETEAEGAEVVVRRVHDYLLEIFQHDGWPVTLAVGVTTFSSLPETVEIAMREAESLMCSAKQPGKSDIKFAVWDKPVAAA